MDNIIVTTWTHSSYDDIWPMYYGQFKKHAPEIKHALFINKKVEHESIPDNCMQIINNEKKDFSERWLSCMNQISEDNIIYMQEDFVLYDRANIEWMKKVQNFLNESNYSFVRLIKSGIEGGACVDSDLKIWEIPENSQYVFACNATIWKRKEFIKLFDYYRPRTILDSELYGSNACRALGMKGCYIYDDEPKRGSLHYDSNIFPYISSALVGHSLGGPSRWLYKHYKKELEVLLKEYKIDPSVRGTIL